jgi:hypothetical protein
MEGSFFMWRWIVIAALSSWSGLALAESQPAPDLVCSGLADDRASLYDVFAFLGQDQRFNRVVLQRSGLDSVDAPETLGDYSHYEDVTPRGPTDIRFMFVFKDATPAGGAHQVMLTEGGFTQAATTQISRVDDDGAVVVASLTCVWNGE